MTLNENPHEKFLRKKIAGDQN